LLGDEFELLDRLVGGVHWDDCRRRQPVAETAEILGRDDLCNDRILFKAVASGLKRVASENNYIRLIGDQLWIKCRYREEGANEYEKHGCQKEIESCGAEAHGPRQEHYHKSPVSSSKQAIFIAKIVTIIFTYNNIDISSPY
jgi:hypothetical protein